MTIDHAARPSRALVVIALLTVYVIWGSTYLAILEAIATIPPLAMAGIRMLLAGLPLLIWLRLRTGQWPDPRAWVWAAGSGVLMFTCGNGAVVWSEQTVPSGLAALIVATVSFWTVLLDAARPGGNRAGAGVWFGILLGFAGLVVLVGPGALRGEGPVPLAGALLLVCGSLAWAVGSLVSVETVKRGLASGLGLGAMQMITGGIGLVVAAALKGEWSEFDLAAVSLRSWAAVLYLVIPGSLIAYTAYIWLLRHTSPAVATTYAYVNPIVAMLLGTWFVGEPFTARIALASLLILGAVAMILRARARGVAPAARTEREKKQAETGTGQLSRSAP